MSAPPSTVGPPAGYFSVGQRLFRGYGPAAVFAALIIVVAVAVPSRVPKSTPIANTNSNAASGVAPGGSTPQSKGAVATGTGAAPGGVAARTGTPGSTKVTPGSVQACGGQQLQIPGDPYSPPCVTFSGSNGGATSRGVTGDSIILSYRLTSDQSFGQTLAQLAGAQLRDTNADNQRTALALADYFNSHFNFYGRKLVIKFFDGQGSLSNELLGYGQAQADADATNAAKQVGAFADITAQSEPYATALERLGVVGFGDPYMPGFWHQSHAPYDWSVATDGTKVATEVANYAVQKLCPQGTPATYAGGPLKNAPRKFAGIAPENELYQVSATVFKQVMNAHGCAVDNFKYSLDLNTESQQAANLVSKLKAGGYTTILCGCDPIFPVYLTGQEASQSYIPEFVEIGAALVDQDYVGQLYNQQAFAHAIGISPNLAAVPYTQTIGYAAYKTIRTDEPAFFVNVIYLQMDMLAIGLQMAGPTLTPATYQKGMFNFPARLGPAGLWSWGPDQYTVPNDLREVCWDPKSISTYNNKAGAYIQTSDQRWTIADIPKGPPGCPIPTS
ncbi:MAG: hypothetical protein ACYDH6_00860 [Acidimicrobiales bacterium]